MNVTLPVGIAGMQRAQLVACSKLLRMVDGRMMFLRCKERARTWIRRGMGHDGVDQESIIVS